MEIEEQLKRVAAAMGEHVDDEQIREHKAFCEEIEENICLGEAGEIVKKLAASATLLLVRGEYAPEVKRACVALNALVLARCANENAGLAEEVRAGLSVILAEDLVPSLSSNTRKH
ncbi:MAG: hypothetical protein A3H76_00160 [Candidatus Lloydbacteria bacterium RIFCSPLOWO2_02_FULL_54_12]|nr:MAG: hypothetical protein A3H76_00160 [Candidatus Lloydbacteria bacterium RIFCSPLOWO2_02_FULL_54_12]